MNRKGYTMERSVYIDENLDNMIRDLGKLVSIPSVLDPDGGKPGAPFGKGCADVLRTFLDIAAGFGFAAVNYDGYAGEVTLGTGKRMIGILGHLDVVSAGEGWETPPFTLLNRDGRLYGRGSSDDKGPVVSSLYAMKYIKESGLLPEDVSIRLITGTDEEEGLRCIAYYLKHAKRLPDASFVPDGYFPLVNAEKGLTDFDLVFDLAAPGNAADTGSPEAVVTLLQGGSSRNVTASNAVCEFNVPPEHRAEILKKLSAEPELSVAETPDGFRVRASGVTVHAMDPDKGKNANNVLICALKHTGIRFSIQPFLDAFTETIGMTCHGELLNCRLEDERSGVLTLNAGTMELKDGIITLGSNARWPISFTYEEILNRLVRGLEKHGFEYRECLMMPPLDVPADSTLVRKLMESYREITGDTEHNPFSIGGATYARSIPNAVSFGPLFPYETELAHQANEYLSIDSLKKMTAIYINALEKLIQA